MPMEMRYPEATFPRIPSMGMRRNPHTMSRSGERYRALMGSFPAHRQAIMSPPVTRAVERDECMPAPPTAMRCCSRSP